MQRVVNITSLFCVSLDIRCFNSQNLNFSYSILINAETWYQKILKL